MLFHAYSSFVVLVEHQLAMFSDIEENMHWRKMWNNVWKLLLQMIKCCEHLILHVQCAPDLPYNVLLFKYLDRSFMDLFKEENRMEMKP